MNIHFFAPVLYYCYMPQKRRVYLIHYTHEPVEQDILSNMAKLSDRLDLDLSYRALIARLHRAKERTGKQLIRVKDRKGQAITIEIREIE